MNKQAEQIGEKCPRVFPVRHGSSGGFTLVELIVALFVLSMGVFGTITLYYLGMDRMRAQQEEQMAMAVLQHAMESAQLLNAGELTAWQESGDGGPGMEELEDAALERRVIPRDENLYEVQATLRWRSSGRFMERRLITLVYARGDPL